MSRARYGLLTTVLRLTQGRRYKRLLNDAKAPLAVQEALLRRILAHNAGTEFGQRHGFHRIANLAEYRQAVPLHTYEDLRPLIERQEATGERCLTAAQPVYYNRTSGTGGAPKNIPVTATSLRRLKNDQQLSAYIWSLGSRVLEGRTFAISGPAVEGRMAGGTPFGSASGLLYRSQSRFVRSRCVLAPELSDVEDYDARYLLMAIGGLAEPRVTLMATANPSTFLRLLSIVDRNLDTILEAIATGHPPDGLGCSAAGVDAPEPRPRRARELAELAAAGPLRYADIWPGLRGVMTWTGGSCGVALGGLSDLLPDGARIIELGYAASEFRGTINVDVRRNVCLPVLSIVFFEFARRAEWEAGTAELCGLEELEEGCEYYVFATTPDGLYRYDINDIVRVTGRVHETPTLEFVQKGAGVTNITGEKLTEGQVLEAVRSALPGRGVRPDFFIMIAHEDTAGYTLFVEAGGRIGAADLAESVDERLCASNIEYRAKRRSGRLAPVALRQLRSGTGDRYRASCVASGQRDAQFKYLHLQYARECRFDFAGAVVTEADGGSGWADAY
ncbi:MAG: GH3 auxin-responsive promoter family protein [bacterium]|nr:GH3 auxin-responsive promoter family protein [bacterium]